MGNPKTIPTLGPQDFGRDIFIEPTGNDDFTFPVNDFFHINRIEDHPDLTKGYLPPHRKSVFILIFITTGSAVRTKGLDTYAFSDNTFFFLPPFQTTSRKQQDLNSKGYFCHFDPQIFKEKFFDKELLNRFSFLQFNGYPIVKIPEESLDTFKGLMHSLEREYNENNKPNLEVISSILHVLFQKLNEHVDSPKRSSENAALRITRLYKNALMQHIYEKHKVTDYANYLNVSPDYLNRCVKATLGKTSHQLLDDMLLLEAKVLLNQTDLNVGEVAFRIGKISVSDFIRFFKSKTGMTPTEYRKNE